MKTKLNEYDITLIAESFADQMYIAKFWKDSKENEMENLEVEYTCIPYYRHDEDEPRFGTTEDSTFKKFIDTTAEKTKEELEGSVAIDEIESLSIANYNVG